MKVSKLIEELQNLQTIHGDLTVTSYGGDGGDHDAIQDASLKDDLYFDHQSEVFHNNGPHIHLS